MKSKKKRNRKKSFRNSYFYNIIIVGFILCSIIGLTFYLKPSFALPTGSNNKDYKIKISPTEKTIRVADVTTFKLDYSPNIKDKTVVWGTENNRIVKVNKKTGQILGLISGEAIIYAYSPSTKIKVKAKIYVKIYFEVISYPNTMKVGNSGKITVTKSPNTIIYFESKNPKIVSVNKAGVLKAIKKGIAYIKVRAKGSNTEKTLKIEVK